MDFTCTGYCTRANKSAPNTIGVSVEFPREAGEIFPCTCIFHNAGAQH